MQKGKRGITAIEEVDKTNNTTDDGYLPVLMQTHLFRSPNLFRTMQIVTVSSASIIQS